MTLYGFDWGPVTVERLAHIEGKGRVIEVATPHRRVQVYVSEQGRSVRVFDVGGLEWIRPLKDAA